MGYITIYSDALLTREGVQLKCDNVEAILCGIVRAYAIIIRTLFLFGGIAMACQGTKREIGLQPDGPVHILLTSFGNKKST